MKKIAKHLSFTLKKIKNKMFMVFAPLLIYRDVLALPRVDLTQDASGGKTLTSAMENSGDLLSSASGLITVGAALAGLIIVTISVYVIWKASKDEREKPVSAFVGIIVGGLMLAIPTLMWMSKNSILG